MMECKYSGQGSTLGCSRAREVLSFSKLTLFSVVRAWDNVGPANFVKSKILVWRFNLTLTADSSEGRRLVAERYRSLHVSMIMLCFVIFFLQI